MAPAPSLKTGSTALPGLCLHSYDLRISRKHVAYRDEVAAEGAKAHSKSLIKMNLSLDRAARYYCGAPAIIVSDS